MADIGTPLTPRELKAALAEASRLGLLTACSSAGDPGSAVAGAAPAAAGGRGALLLVDTGRDPGPARAVCSAAASALTASGQWPGGPPFLVLVSDPKGGLDSPAGSLLCATVRKGHGWAVERRFAELRPAPGPGRERAWLVGNGAWAWGDACVAELKGLFSENGRACPTSAALVAEALSLGLLARTGTVQPRTVDGAACRTGSPFLAPPEGLGVEWRPQAVCAVWAALFGPDVPQAERPAPWLRFGSWPRRGAELDVFRACVEAVAGPCGARAAVEAVLAGVPAGEAAAAARAC